MTRHFSLLLQRFTFSDRRGQSSPGANVFMPRNPSHSYIWSKSNIPCRGLLVLLYNKCPLSLFKMCPAVNITYCGLSRCLEASVPTNSLCSPVRRWTQTHTKKHCERNVRSHVHFVLSRLPLKKIVFGDRFQLLHQQCWGQHCRLDVNHTINQIIL